MTISSPIRQGQSTELEKTPTALECEEGLIQCWFDDVESLILERCQEMLLQAEWDPQHGGSSITKQERADPVQF